MVRHWTGQMSMQASHSMQQRRLEDGLHVAVEAALDLARGLLGGEAELDLEVERLEALASARRGVIFWRGDGL